MRLMEFSAETSLLSAVEMTEDGNMLVRAYETAGKTDRALLRLPFRPVAGSV